MNFSNRGITLIEIFVVITITAITLAIAIPNFSKYVKKYGVGKEITEIYGDLVEQRFKSMSSGVPNGVIFDNVTGTRYTLFEFDDSNSTGSSRYNMKFDTGEDIISEIKDNLKFPIETSISTSEKVVLFDERGMARNKNWSHGGFTLHVKNPPEGTRNSCIKVYWTRIKTGMWDNSGNGTCEVK